ncbi:MAG: extracellular solute-binding protein [Lachnospiraceae bacterium]|nr:extracellular solute-binding protein [Lachnospiraceae bacterium]
MKKMRKRAVVPVLMGVTLFALAACGQKETGNRNLVSGREEERETVYMFGPMEKSRPDAKNTARSAADITFMRAEDELNLTVEYRIYTAEDYQEKTYDEVLLDRARHYMDDLYLMNPDSIRILGEEGKLADLSDLESAQNLREVVKTANTINGKLVAIPQEVVVYGLFVNKNMFDQYGLSLPEKPEDLMECCRVFKENGIETPIGANRWWLETIVLAQAYADLYNGGDTEAKIQALNDKETRYSDYMRPGFEYLKEMIDKGYIDARAAYTYEAIEGEGPDFLAQKTPIVMAYWGAANSDTAYGNPDFNMQVIGFPSDYGPMPVVSITGYGISAGAEHPENARKVLDVITSDEALKLYSDINHVISPSVNVQVDCIDALKPLNDRINEGVCVLGANAGMELEQWGNTCLIVRELLNGASVDECMAEFDRLQDEL